MSLTVIIIYFKFKLLFYNNSSLWTEYEKHILTVCISNIFNFCCIAIDKNNAAIIINIVFIAQP